MKKTIALALVLKQKRMEFQERAIVVAGNSPDERLILLASRLNAVAANVSCAVIAEPDERQQCATLLSASLADISAYALIWATTGQRNYTRGCEAITTERTRQKRLFMERKISFDCASPIVDHRRKFRVLFEECGEVADAIDQIENHGMAAGNLNMELIQVAAVGVAWLESMEVLL